MMIRMMMMIIIMRIVMMTTLTAYLKPWTWTRDNGQLSPIKFWNLTCQAKLCRKTFPNTAGVHPRNLINTGTKLHDGPWKMYLLSNVAFLNIYGRFHFEGSYFSLQRIKFPKNSKRSVGARFALICFLSSELEHHPIHNFGDSPNVRACGKKQSFLLDGLNPFEKY